MPLNDKRIFLLFLHMISIRLVCSVLFLFGGIAAYSQKEEVTSSATDSKVRIERGSGTSDVSQQKGYPKRYSKKNKKAARNVIDQPTVYKKSNKRQQRRNNKMRLNGRDE
jgi:hypothetical protein